MYQVDHVRLEKQLYAVDLILRDRSEIAEMQQTRSAQQPQLVPMIQPPQRTATPFEGHQAVRDLLAQARNGPYMQQLTSLTTLSKLLEDEEAAFRSVAGDPWAIPNQRQGFNIGAILALIKVW